MFDLQVFESHFHNLRSASAHGLGHGICEHVRIARLIGTSDDDGNAGGHVCVRAYRSEGELSRDEEYEEIDDDEENEDPRFLRTLRTPRFLRHRIIK